MSITVPSPVNTDTDASTPDRTVTYPLLRGGFLAAPCPSWCTVDHSDDAEQGIHPGDLLHQGDEVALSFDLADGTSTRVLCVRIEQYPFANDGESDRPHASLVPADDDGESTGYLSAAELKAEIRRAETHLYKLRQLAERLAEARVEEHSAYYASLGRDSAGMWAGLSRDDVAAMPVWYLLKAFAVTVVEVDNPDKTILVEELTAHRDGSHTLHLDRALTQIMREQATRRLLANRLEGARIGVAKLDAEAAR